MCWFASAHWCVSWSAVFRAHITQTRHRKSPVLRRAPTRARTSLGGTWKVQTENLLSFALNLGIVFLPTQNSATDEDHNPTGKTYFSETRSRVEGAADHTRHTHAHTHAHANTQTHTHAHTHRHTHKHTHTNTHKHIQHIKMCPPHHVNLTSASLSCGRDLHCECQTRLGLRVHLSCTPPPVESLTSTSPMSSRFSEHIQRITHTCVGPDHG